VPDHVVTFTKDHPVTAHSARVAVATLLAACAAGPQARPPAAAPTPAAAPALIPDTPAAIPTPPPIVPTPLTAARLGPQVGRFLAHQVVEIHNDYAGLPPRQTIGYQSWFTVTVHDSIDSGNRLAATFVVDSLAADSGVLLPPTMNLGAARGLTVTGWVSPTGEFQDPVFSDSAVVQSLSLLLGWFRRFFPHVPADGAQPGSEWTDTLTTTEPGGSATVTRISELRARAAAAWEHRPEGQALRLDAEETYQFTGSGDGGGQPLELRGTGVRSGTDYIAVDGRYLGGTSRDSVSLTITLPQQGITIPQRQLGTLSVSLLPR
jgi:hypothetical protein